jgi:hypothetical protein
MPVYHIFDAEALVPYLLYRNGRVVDGLRFDEALPLPVPPTGLVLPPRKP